MLQDSSKKTDGGLMKVAVCQPHYLPWTGHLALIDSVDTYVFYDDVQFSPQSWQQRNRIKTSNGIHWLTIPIERSFPQNINEVKINQATPWRDKHWETIQQAYSKVPHFIDSAKFWEDFYGIRFFYLTDTTEYLTRMMMKGFNLNEPRYIQSSEMGLEGDKTDRLINLLTQIGATEYVSGVGAKAYIEEDKFKKAGIKLTWFNYKHPIYSQLYGEFVPYMSAIDLLMNEGDNSAKILRKGIR